MAERYGTRTREEIGGKATSAVPAGTTGTSAVTGAEAGTADAGCVVNTSAGAWMTPMVGGVSEGRRSSSERENPYATSVPAATTPIVTPINVLRDRPFDSIVSIVSTTTATLSR